MNADKPYKVVRVPTALGIVSSMVPAKILGEFEKKEDADEYAYLEWCDEPASDKAGYYKIEVVKYGI